MPTGATNERSIECARLEAERAAQLVEPMNVQLREMLAPFMKMMTSKSINPNIWEEVNKLLTACLIPIPRCVSRDITWKERKEAKKKGVDVKASVDMAKFFQVTDLFVKDVRGNKGTVLRDLVEFRDRYAVLQPKSSVEIKVDMDVNVQLFNRVMHTAYDYNDWHDITNSGSNPKVRTAFFVLSDAITRHINRVTIGYTPFLAKKGLKYGCDDFDFRVVVAIGHDSEMFDALIVDPKRFADNTTHPDAPTGFYLPYPSLYTKPEHFPCMRPFLKWVKPEQGKTDYNLRTRFWLVRAPTFPLICMSWPQILAESKVMEHLREVFTFFDKASETFRYFARSLSKYAVFGDTW